MNWTRDKPTKDGYYWLRRREIKTKVVWVWDTIGLPMVASCGSDWDKEISELDNTDSAEWYGPLEPP